MISVTHDASTFILKSLFNICSYRTKVHIFEIFIDEFMTNMILQPIGMKDFEWLFSFKS